MSKIVVLGSGSGSHAMAADLAINGNEVYMLVLPEWIHELAPVIEKGYIQTEGILCEKARIKCVTSDPKKALDGAECIFCPLPAYAQESYCKWIADFIQNDQILLFTPGLMGCLIMKKVMDNKKIDKKILLAETSELPYSCRGSSGTVNIMSKFQVMCSALPAIKTQEVIETASKFLPLIKAENILQCAIHSTNPCYHVPGCILNAGRIERSKGEFYLYEEGITPCVARVMEILDEERMKIANEVGGLLFSVPEEMAGSREPRTIFEELNGCMSMEFIKGPSSLQDRYLTEDIPYGLMVWSEIARIAGVETPMINALIEISSPILKMDILSEGRNAEKMGVAGMNIDRLMFFVNDLD